MAWHSRPGAARVFNWLWKGVVRQKVADEHRRHHPMQKPVALMEWCIAQAGSPDLVVDPYMGSGSTGVAAARLGKRFIGVEIDERWFEAACRRIAVANAAAKAAS